MDVLDELGVAPAPVDDERDYKQAFAATARELGDGRSPSIKRTGIANAAEQGACDAAEAAGLFSAYAITYHDDGRHTDDETEAFITAKLGDWADAVDRWASSSEFTTPPAVRDVVKGWAAVERAVDEACDRIRGPNDWIDRFIANSTARQAQESETKRRERFRVITAAELAGGDYRQEYLVPGVVAAGQPLLIGGGFKTLKTSIAVDLALSLATGTRFLGEFVVPERKRVALLSGESGLSALQSIAQRIATERGTLLSTCDSFLVSPDLPMLTSMDDIAATQLLIEDRELDALLIDPAYLCMTGAAEKSGNIFGMGEYLKPLSELGERTGCTIVILHHTRKHQSTTFEPAELGDVQWSGFAEWAAQWLLLSRRSRFDPETGQHELWMNAGGRAGHAGLWGVDIDEGVQDVDTGGGRIWSAAVCKASEIRADKIADQVAIKEQRQQEKAEAQAEAYRERIRKAMAKFPEGETAKVIRVAAGLNPDRFNLHIADLIESGEVEPCDIIKPPRKTAFDGFRLSTGTTGTSGTVPVVPQGDQRCGTKPLKGGCSPGPDPMVDAGSCSPAPTVDLFDTEGF